MTSISQDERGYWTAGFRAYRGSGRGGRRRVRVPITRLRQGSEMLDAMTFAQECDRSLRALEQARWPSLQDVRYALDLKAITPEQGEALLGEKAVPSHVASPERYVLQEAALAHPASAEEERRDLKSADYHAKKLRQFADFAKVQFVEEVTLALVQSWIVDLRRQTFSWDGRRHALLWVRRACRMGTTRGIPDVLAGFRLDRQERRPAIAYWTLQELCAGLVRASDPRVRAAIALGGLMGLRPSEIYRVEIPDIEDGVLHIGLREAKNSRSVRSLPIPKLIRPWLAEVAGERTVGPLLMPNAPAHLTRRRAGAFNKTTFGHWLVTGTTAAIGRRLPIKCLRKSFFTWALKAGLDPKKLEPWFGHQSELISEVSSNHYMGAWLTRELEPLARKIDSVAGKAMAQARDTREAHESVPAARQARR